MVNIGSSERRLGSVRIITQTLRVNTLEGVMEVSGFRCPAYALLSYGVASRFQVSVVKSKSLSSIEFLHPSIPQSHISHPKSEIQNPRIQNPVVSSQ